MAHSPSRACGLVCFAIVVIIAPIQAAGTRIFRCEAGLEDITREPDLDVVRVRLTPGTDTYLKRMALSEAWMTEALRRSPRKLYHPPSWEAAKFVSFLPLDDQGTTLRVEYLREPETDGILVIFASGYTRARDHALFEEVLSRATLRGTRLPIVASDWVLNQMQRESVSVEDLEHAFLHRLAAPVKDRYDGLLWLLGRMPCGRRLSIKFQRRDQILVLKWVQRPSGPQSSCYFTRAGVEAHETPPTIEVTKGTFRGRRIQYGIGLESKIQNDHGVARAEVREAFEIARNGVPDDAPSAKDKGTREWIAARLASGRILKVVYVCLEDGGLMVLTAHDTDEYKLGVYRRLLRKFGLKL